MTLSSDLFKAILSMDAYNRGYDASIALTGDSLGNAQIATMVNDLGETVALDSSILDNSDQGIGFYALSYVYDGDIVIAYRGTDYPEDDTIPPKDIFHGWSLGAGNLESEQAQMAVEFYKAILTSDKSDLNIDPQTFNYALTGHSLGGGLAGYVSGLYGLDATVFDAMTFKLAAENTYNEAVDLQNEMEDGKTYKIIIQQIGDPQIQELYVTDGVLEFYQNNVDYIIHEEHRIEDLFAATVYQINNSDFLTTQIWDPDFSDIDGYHVKDEILDLTLIARSTSGNPAETKTPIYLGEDGEFYDLVDDVPWYYQEIYERIASWAAGPIGQGIATLYSIDRMMEGIALHSQASLVIRQFADENGQEDTTAWQKAAQYFWPVLYNNAFAQSIGFEDSDPNSVIRGELQDQGKYADILRMVIAYSAIDEGADNTSARPFGDTAIRALYDDANDLGGALQVPDLAEKISMDYAEEISKAFVQYAATLSLNKVLQSDPNHPDVLSGILTISDNLPANPNENSSLTIDFTDKSWGLGEDGALPNMIARTDLIGKILLDSGHNSTIRDHMFDLWGDGSTNIFDRVIFNLRNYSSGEFDLDDIDVGSEKATLFIGGYNLPMNASEYNSNQYIGDDRDTLFILGRNSSTVTGGAGDDIFMGSDLYNFLDGGAGSDVYILPDFVSDYYSPTIEEDKTLQVLLPSDAGAKYTTLGFDTLDLSNYGQEIYLDTYYREFYNLSGAGDELYGDYDGIENFILTDFDDTIDLTFSSYGSYRYASENAIIDAGDGIDTVMLHSDSVIDSQTIYTGQSNAGQYEITNAEIIDFQSLINGYTVTFLELTGRTYLGGDSSSDAARWFDYSSVDTGLNVDFNLHTVSNGTLTDTLPGGSIRGSNYGDNVSVYDGYNYSLGTGNDNVTIGGAGSGLPDITLYWTGGNDHIYGGGNIYGGLDLRLKAPVEISDINIGFLNVTDETYDLKITAGSYGSVTYHDISITRGVGYVFLPDGTYMSPYIGDADPYELYGAPNNNTSTSTIGGHGNDIIHGDMDDNVSMYGHFGNDVLFGYEGNDYLYGGSGDDELYGGDDDDMLYGHNGNDLLDGGEGDDYVLAGNGDDILQYVYNSSEVTNDIYAGGGGEDFLQIYLSDADYDSAMQASIQGLYDWFLNPISLHSVGQWYEFSDTGTNIHISEVEKLGVFVDDVLVLGEEPAEPVLNIPDPIVDSVAAVENLSDPASLLNGLGEITIAIQLQASEIGTDRGIFDGDAERGGDDNLMMRYDAQGFDGGGANVIKASVTTTGGTMTLESASNVQTTDPQHLVMTWKTGEDLKLYIDGAQTSPTAISGTASGTITGVEDLLLGIASKPDAWAGTIDGFQIFDTALSNAEIYQLATGLPLPDNFDPIASDDIASTYEDMDVTINVLANDSDIDQDLLSVSSVTQGTNGSIVINPNKTVTYTPNAGFFGMDSFLYTVEDGNGGSNIATVTVTINEAISSGPIPIVNGVAEAENLSDPASLLNGLSEITVMALVQASTNDVNSDRGIFDGDADSGGDDVLMMRYDAQGFDGGGTNVIKVGLTTTDGIISLESASNIQTTDPQHLTMTWRSGEGLKLYINGIETVPTSASGTATGAISGVEDLLIGIGSKRVTGGWAGTIDDFKIFDSALDSGEVYALATGGAGPVNVNPLAADDFLLGDQDETISGNVLDENGGGIDSDPNGDNLSVVVQNSLSTAQGGLVSIGANGSFYYTPASGFVGLDSFAYTVEDGNGGSDVGTVTLDIYESTPTPAGVPAPIVDGVPEATYLADPAALLNGMDEVTISVRVQASEIGTDRGIFDGDAERGGDDNLMMRYDAQGFDGGGANVIKASVTTTGGTMTLESASNVQTTDPQHLVMTWKTGEDLKLYIDGAQTSPTAVSGTASGTITGIEGLLLGLGPKNDGGWAGAIDDFEIYDVALDAIQISDLFLQAPPALNPVNGTSSSESVNGTSGDDLLNGREGDDSINGYAGDDDYVWGIGDGNDYISEQGGYDQILFGAGITESNIRLEKEGLNLNIHIGTEVLSIASQFYDDSYGNGTEYILEEALFDDGGAISLINNLTFTGTSINDDMFGTSGSDIFYAKEGNDVIYAGGGDDVLYGEDGLDTFYGGLGADTFVFEAASAYSDIDGIYDFSLAEGDALDLIDLLTAYDPLSDLITDFVEITDDGTNSYVAVDANGGADNFVQIATIGFTTGLTDEAALETSGVLITS